MDNNSNTSSPIVITISRQRGSGGRQIGQMLAERLGIAYYDKVILSQAAEETGLGRNVFHHTDSPKGFFRQFVGAVQPFIGGGDFYSSQLSDDNVFALQSGIIKRLAAERSCVIIGRAADHILSDHPQRLRIFLTANHEDRIRRVMDQNKVDYKTAVRTASHADDKRASYYNFYASGTWGSAENYDLCLNISQLGTEGTVDFICEYIKRTMPCSTEINNLKKQNGEQIYF